jgi:hypothetical protein
MGAFPLLLLALIPYNILAFGGGDLRSQVFRRAFHLLGVHRHPGQRHLQRARDRRR